jgi:N4-gp56 family major capsid protein
MATDNTTTTLSPAMQTYYEKVFLERGEYALILKEGGQLRTHPANEGKTVNFTRLLPSDIDATALTESCNPPACIVTACTVAMTLAEYGKTFRSSKFLTLTSIDSKQKEMIEVVGQSMGETLNRVVRTELRNGTAFRPNSHTVATEAAGDTLSASAIREITKTLEIAKAMPYKDGTFMGKTNPYSKYSLLGDSTWIAAKTYSDVKDLYKGEMGELYQVRWLNNIDEQAVCEATSTSASTVAVYYTYVHGDNSFGVYDLEGDKPKLYILPNVVDSGSPAGRISLISWAGSYVAKLLNSDWLLACRFTAT